MVNSANLRAGIYMMIAMGLFTIGDSITKILAQEMNGGQYMLVRGCFATAIITTLAWYQGSLRKIGFNAMVALRVAAEVVAAITYIYVLKFVSQAFASSIFQAVPLFVTIGAAVFLREHVGWRRWTCILIGLVGVLIIIRPGGNEIAGITSIGLLLLSVLAAAVRDIATRRVPDTVPTLYLSTLTTVATTMIGAAIIMPMGGWTPLTINSVFLCIIAAVLLLIGYSFIIMAMRQGEISFVSPFRYTSLLWAIILSTVIFREPPDLWTIFGALIVVSSGVYMIYRESVLNKRAEQRSTLASIPTGIDPS
ncbi:DMT family transporter [Paenochrobactrum glaciei]|uniref:DMT family transporter n=1 Tax=Paenochrobactrum glaciei TaxID=486407 RepID=A0ABP3QIL2_9HYPH